MTSQSQYDQFKNDYLQALRAADVFRNLAVEVLDYINGALTIGEDIRDVRGVVLSDVEKERRETAIKDLFLRVNAATNTLNAVPGRAGARTFDAQLGDGPTGVPVELTPASAQTAYDKLTTSARVKNSEADALKQQAFNESFERFRDDPDFSPQEFALFASEDPLFNLLNPGVFEGGAAGRVGPRFTPTVFANGDIWMFGDDGSTKFAGNFPAAVQKSLEIDPRTGDLIAFGPDGVGTVVREGFGFAQIDPERTFALEALQTDIAFKGLELTQRGLEIQALGQDFANQVMLGRMAFEQAQLNLNRVNSAFDVRRQEREVALSFAVKQSSIRVLPDGSRVTRLPFAESIARRLGLPISEFELPVGEVNPEAAAQALLDATSFEDPIPALQGQAADTAGAIDTILGAPLPSSIPEV